MVYGVCERCAHTRDFTGMFGGNIGRWFDHCYSCGLERWFRIVRQIEQPDGSVIEVTA